MQSLNQVEITAAGEPGDNLKAQPSIGKLTQPILDTPQSISSVTSQELADRGFTDLNDTLRYVPGISLGAGETSYQGNSANLRGFTTRDDMFLDGQRDYGYYYRDPFNDQELQVLKGPSSILFGRGSTGGVVNEVSKSPTLAPFLAAAVALGTSNRRRATLDIDSPLPVLGAGAAARLNAMGERTKVADRHGARDRRWGVAPSLALGLGTPTRLEVSYFHQTNDDVPDYGIPWLDGRPAPVDRANFYGFPSDYLDTDVNVLTARLEHDVAPDLQIRSQARYSRDTRRFRITEAVIPAGTPAATPVAAITVNRNEFEGYSTDTFLEDQTDVIARFDTGGVSHSLVGGAELGRESPEPTYITNVGVPGTNLAHPGAQIYSAAQSYIRLEADTVARTAGLYVLDTAQIARQWQIMAGVRWDRFDATYTSAGFSAAGAPISNTAVDHIDKAFSYRGALAYKPRPSGSIYLAFGTSFDPSAEGIESLISSGRKVAQANLDLDPEKNRSYELGTKWDLDGSRIEVTGALFRLEKYNARVPDPDNPGFNVLGGDERVDGLEADLAVHLTRAWLVRASYTYLDSQVIRSVPGGPLLGAPLTITPRNSSSVWTEYQLAGPLEFGIGALQTSSRLGQNTAASYEVAPGYVILNALMKYQVSPHVLVQLNVDNLTNRYYWDQLHAFHAIPGEGAVAQLTVTAGF